MNDQFEQVSVWGPRAREAQEFVTQLRVKNYHLKMHTIMRIKKEVHHEITSKYKSDTDLWNQVYDSIISKLML